MGVRSKIGIFFNATLCNQNLIERNLIIQLVIRITSMQEMIDYQVHCVMIYDYIILHCSMEFHLAPVMYEEIFLTFRGSASDANENRKASAISFSLSFQFRSKKTKNNNM